MIYYKIRNKETGLYHKGGVYNVWTKAGKTWTTLGQLRSMLTMNINSQNSEMHNWEIIEYEVKETAVKALHEVIKPEKLISIIKKF